MFETVVPYTPKARSRLCRLCSRRISSIRRIRSRDAPSRVTAEKGKKKPSRRFTNYWLSVKET